MVAIKLPGRSFTCSEVGVYVLTPSRGHQLPAKPTMNSWRTAWLQHPHPLGRGGFIIRQVQDKRDITHIREVEMQQSQVQD